MSRPEQFVFFAIAQAGRPSAGGRRASEVLVRVRRDGSWWLSHRGSRSGASRRAHYRPEPGLCFSIVRALSLVRRSAFQGAYLEALARLPGRAQAHRLRRLLTEVAPAFGSCLRAWRAPRGASRSVVPYSCCVCGKHFVPRAAWRGKLALMACKEALLHQPPNPSIERTPSSVLRTLPAAAHVQR